MNTKRHILSVILPLILFLGIADAEDNFSWSQIEKIRNTIRTPEIPDTEYSITDFGAESDKDCTLAFECAIERCFLEGGGRVIVPPGNYLSGPIYLKSNVNLHLMEGARISFFTEPEKYLPEVLTRYEGVEVMNYSPLIYARGESNIAITGKGLLDGNANALNWWKMVPPSPKHEDPKNPHTRTILFDMAEKGIDVSKRQFGNKSLLRPSFVEFYECERVLVEGITIKNAPFWMIHPVLSKHITVREVTCESYGTNNDGCDPESSEYVLIENCVFNTKDDGVAIKSGRNADGRRIGRASRNIVVSNCVMNTQHTAVAIGSEMTGGVEHVYVENLTCSQIQRLFRIKTNSMRGGFVRHVGMRNVQVEEATGTLIDFRTNYGREVGNYYTDVEDIVLQDIVCERANQAISFRGTEKMPFVGANLERIRVKEVLKPTIFHHVQNLYQTEVELGTSFSSQN